MDFFDNKKDGLEEKLAKEHRNKLVKISTEVCGAAGVESILSSSRQIEEVLLELGATSSDFGMEPSKVVQLIRDFSNAFFARLNIVNLEPKDTIKMMNTATYLMGPGAQTDKQADAKEMAKKILNLE